jgi:hypothetical protein
MRVVRLRDHARDLIRKGGSFLASRGGSLLESDQALQSLYRATGHDAALTREDLYNFLARLLGWSNARLVALALRAVDLATQHQAVLVLCGAGDLVPVAHALHRRTLGADRPFVVCAEATHPRRCVRRFATGPARPRSRPESGEPCTCASAAHRPISWTP